MPRRTDPNQTISPYEANGTLKPDHQRFIEPKADELKKQGFFNPREYGAIWDKLSGYMPGKSNDNYFYNLLENNSHLTTEEVGSVFNPAIGIGSAKSLDDSIASGDYNEQFVYENLVKRGMKEAVNQEALFTIQHRLASSLASKYKDFLKDIDFHQILKNNMRKNRFV